MQCIAIFEVRGVGLGGRVRGSGQGYWREEWELKRLLAHVCVCVCVCLL